MRFSISFGIRHLTYEQLYHFMPGKGLHFTVKCGTVPHSNEHIFGVVGKEVKAIGTMVLAASLILLMTARYMLRERSDR